MMAVTTVFVILILIQCIISTVTNGYRHDDSIMFLEHNFSIPTWSKIQSQINCIVSNGDWVNKHTRNHESKIYEYPCIHMRYTEGECSRPNYNNRVGLNFSWEVSNDCNYDSKSYQWSSQDMCKLLSFQRVLVLGDSLSEEFFLSLYSALVNTDERFKEGYLPSCDKYNVSLWMIRHDHFIITETNQNYKNAAKFDPRDPFQSSEGRMFGERWHHELQKRNISLLIVNRGAHYAHHEIALSEISNTLDWMKTHYPKVSIIFRSTGSGHGQCGSYKYFPPLAKNITYDYTTNTLHENYKKYF